MERFRDRDDEAAALPADLPRLGDGGADARAGRLGSKAAALDALARAGFRVPRGFVIPTDVDLEELSTEALTEAVASAGGFPVAVRSSGALEDLAGASFAGQYETFLDVADGGELARAARACRRSGDSDRVRAYADARGVADGASLAGAGVAVLVQEMIEPDLAGVAFSLHPITGREEHALVELVSGKGERLVSGRVTPTSLALALPGGEVVDETRGSDDRSLSPAAARELARRLLELQAYFGRPQDVEWALDASGQLFILQSRPITRVQWRTDTAELTNADFRDGGVSARVCTPLMYALYRDAMQPSMQRFLEDVRLLGRGQRETWIGYYYGRPYWNASAVKMALAVLPGFDEAQFDRDLGIHKDYGPSGPARTRLTPRAVLGALPAARALRREQRDHLARVRRFRAPFMAAYARWRRRAGALAETSDTAFFRDLRDLFAFQRGAEESYFRTIYNNSIAQTDLSALLARIDAATGRETRVTRLFGGLAGVHHMAMQEGIATLCRAAAAEGARGPAFEAALSSFLDEHGFHADAELDLAVPRWENDPERVRRMIDAMVAAGHAPADPREALARQRERYREERREVHRALRGAALARLRYARSFERKLARARAYLAAREEMREYSTRAYALIRRYVLDAGRRLCRRGALASEDDVFMMEPAEIADLGEGRRTPADVGQVVESRRLLYRGYAEFPAPNEFGRGVEEAESAAPAADASGRRILRGIGCSAGAAAGRARVVTDVAALDALEAGDILVTRFTDPGWTPAFGVAGAVVTEVGGLLSHAAVIGREYGVPAVLSVKGATEHIPPGARVRVDGDRGTVEVEEEPP